MIGHRSGRERSGERDGERPHPERTTSASSRVHGVVTMRRSSGSYNIAASDLIAASCAARESRIATLRCTKRIGGFQPTVFPDRPHPIRHRFSEASMARWSPPH
jgi:hypothetical protein